MKRKERQAIARVFAGKFMSMISPALDAGKQAMGVGRQKIFWEGWDECAKAIRGAIEVESVQYRLIDQALAKTIGTQTVKPTEVKEMREQIKDLTAEVSLLKSTDGLREAVLLRSKVKDLEESLLQKDREIKKINQSFAVLSQYTEDICKKYGGNRFVPNDMRLSA